MTAALALVVTLQGLHPGTWTLVVPRRHIRVRVAFTQPSPGSAAAVGWTWLAERVVARAVPGVGVRLTWGDSCFDLARTTASRRRLRGVFRSPCDGGAAVPFRGTWRRTPRSRGVLLRGRVDG